DRHLAVCCDCSQPLMALFGPRAMSALAPLWGQSGHRPAARPRPDLTPKRTRASSEASIARRAGLDEPRRTGGGEQKETVCTVRPVSSEQDVHIPERGQCTSGAQFRASIFRFHHPGSLWHLQPAVAAVAASSWGEIMKLTTLLVALAAVFSTAVFN